MNFILTIAENLYLVNPNFRKFVKFCILELTFGYKHLIYSHICNILLGCILMKKFIVSFFVVCLIAFWASQAKAVSPYIGLDYVYSKYNYDMGERYSGKWFQEKYDGGVASLGLKLNNNFAIEGFYQQTESNQSQTSGFAATGDTLTTKMRFKAYGVDLVRDLLNARVVEVLASVGVAKYEVDVSRDYSAGGVSSLTKERLDGEGLRLGIGMQLNFSQHYAFRTMFRYSLTTIDEIEDIKEITAGIRYTF